MLAARRGALAALLALAACADLPPREAGVCGNGVQEDGEDCDVVGGSLQCVQCRFACTSRNDCPNQGWGCGSDGICRHGTGIWHEVGTPVPESAIDMDVADLDGDGRLDLYGFSEGAVWTHLALPGGGFGGGFSVPHTLGFGTPAFGDFDRNGFLDATFARPRSLLVALGHRPVTGLAVVPQTSLTELGDLVEVLPIRTHAAPFDDLLVLTETVGALAASVQPIGAPAPPSVALGTGPASAPIVAAVLDFDGDDRDELAVVTNGTVVRVLGTVDDALGQASLTPRAVVDFGTNVAGPLFAVDVTGDGVRDLVANVDVTGQEFPEGVMVAAGNAAGGFGPPQRDASFEGQGRLLALADLDGDGQADWVGATGVFLRRGGVSTPVAASVSAWEHAVIADFNRDGVPDVAALSTAPGVEVLLGATGGLFDHSVRSTTRHFSTVTVGDFDGDRFTDLALLGPVGAQGDAELVVLYGGPAGVTDDPVSMAVLPIEGLAHADLRLDPGLSTVDAATDLVLTIFGDGPSAHDLIFLLGNSDRFPDAPLDVGRDPVATLMGRFDPDTYQAGVLLMYADGSADLVEGRGVGQLRRTDLVAESPSGLLPWCLDGDAQAQGALVADLDGDGRDEIIGVACDDSVSSRVQVVKVGGTHAAPTLTATNLSFPADATDFQDLRSAKLVDLDRDGKLDLVLTYSSDVQRVVGPSASGLIVFWGGGGTLSGESTVLAASPFENWRTFEVLDADDQPTRELLIDHDGTAPLRVDLSVDMFGRRFLTRDTSGLKGLPVGGTFAAGANPGGIDVNGDGVDDVVIDTADGIRVFLGCDQHDTTVECQ